jgi:hypothetical protein
MCLSLWIIEFSFESYIFDDFYFVSKTFENNSYTSVHFFNEKLSFLYSQICKLSNSFMPKSDKNKFDKLLFERYKYNCH